nr:immunoglobulin-like domain-containing protein [Microbulbifer salipaludis]
MGAKRMQLLHGSGYRDPGATAVDKEDGDISHEITVTGLPIDTSTPGDYKVTYSVTDSGESVDTEERLVTIEENRPPSISLLGEEYIEIKRGSVFTDPGATARDTEDGDITSEIQVVDHVDSNTVGDYSVDYRVRDSAGAEVSASRRVTVTEAPSPYSHIPVTIDKQGYTTVVPAQDSKLIYVSNSTGDNHNDGLTPESPVKTIVKGKSLLRDGYPDWLLLKIGDQWPEGLGKWVKSGRSPKEPMVVTAYGKGVDRPLLMTGSNDGLRASGGGGSPKIIENLVVSGLHFYAHTRDPDSESFTSVSVSRGINWFRGTSYLLIEDNYIEHYKEGIQIDDLDNLNISGVTIRRNVIVDSYSTSSHAQGIYVARSEGVLIEENTFDHNGWHESFPGANATKFNHSIYIQNGNLDIDIRNNIISRSSSHGMQLRPGGVIDGNFLIRNPISILLGLSDSGVSDGKITNNIILNGNDIGPGPLQRGWGIDFKPENNALVENNIVAHVLSAAGNRFGIKESAVATYGKNIVYRWEEGTDAGKSYSDPERTIEEFDQILGGDGTFESFIANIRSQSRLNWNQDYSIENIKQFFREGFAEKTL